MGRHRPAAIHNDTMNNGLYLLSPFPIVNQGQFKVAKILC